METNIAKKSKIDRLNMLIFSLLFILWFTLEYIFSLTISKFPWGSRTYYLQILSILKYLLCLYIIIFKRYSLKQWIFVAACAALFFVSARKSGYYELFYGWLFIVAAQGIHFQKIVKYTAVMLAIYMPITVLLSVTGVLENVVYYRNELEHTTARYALGFEHPNGFGFRMFILVFSWLYQKNRRLRFYDYFLIISTIVIAWTVLNSKATCVCIFLTGAIFTIRPIFEKLSKNNGKLLLSVFAAGAVTSAIATVVFSLFYIPESRVLFLINKILSQRLKYAHQAYSEFGLSLIGQQAFVTRSERTAIGLEGEIILDNAFFVILFRFGLVVFVVFMTLYLWTMIKEIKQGDYLKSCSLTLLALYGVIELFLYWPMWNPFLMLLADLFQNDSQTEFLPRSLIQRLNMLQRRRCGRNY